MEIKIKKLCLNAVLPTKAHIDDAGWDLYAANKSFDKNGNVVYGTGLAFEIPKGHVGLLFPRSSNAKKQVILTNCVGVLDSGYRGEVMFKFKPLYKIQVNNDEPFKCFNANEIYEVGDRIGQMIIIPYPQVEFTEVDELSDTERGDGGYGSSGR